MTPKEWKKLQFLMEVQTAFLANGINRSLDEDALEKRHIFSAVASLGFMDDAFFAADRIPAGLNAHQAACDWLAVSLFREDDAPRPHWAMRG